MAELTPHAGVNRVLDLLRERVSAVLGDHLVGLYLYGSLAIGDFTPGRSDIDILVVTEDRLPESLLPDVKAMHAAITQLGRADDRYAWATKLEGPYMPRAAIRRYDPVNDIHPALRVDGSFDLDGHGIGWNIQRHVIRERGITVTGPPPDTLIDPLTVDDLRRASAGVLRGWWEPMLTDSWRLRDSEYQAYAVLTMCRSLYTLQTGDVTTKSEAVQWALKRLGQQWAYLINHALVWREGMALDDLDGVQGLIRYTLNQLPEL